MNYYKNYKRTLISSALCAVLGLSSASAVKQDGLNKNKKMTPIEVKHKLKRYNEIENYLKSVKYYGDSAEAFSDGNLMFFPIVKPYQKELIEIKSNLKDIMPNEILDWLKLMDKECLEGLYTNNQKVPYFENIEQAITKSYERNGEQNSMLKYAYILIRTMLEESPENANFIDALSTLITELNAQCDGGSMLCYEKMKLIIKKAMQHLVDQRREEMETQGKRNNPIQKKAYLVNPVILNDSMLFESDEVKKSISKISMMNDTAMFGDNSANNHKQMPINKKKKNASLVKNPKINPLKKEKEIEKGLDKNDLNKEQNIILNKNNIKRKQLPKIPIILNDSAKVNHQIIDASMLNDAVLFGNNSANSKNVKQINKNKK